MASFEHLLLQFKHVSTLAHCRTHNPGLLCVADHYVILQVLSLLINQLSRRYEFQADNFAVKLGHAPELREALKKLDSNNKSAPNVDKWYSAYHYSHPPLLERLTAIDEASLKLRKQH